MKNMIIYMAITIHFIWAFTLIMSPTVEGVTGLNLLYTIFPNRYLLAFILVCSSTLALYALKNFRQIRSLLLLLPQQFLLLVPSVAVINAIYVSHFADGVIRSRYFLITDKFSIVVFAIFHTIVLLQFHNTSKSMKIKL